MSNKRILRKIGTFPRDDFNKVGIFSLSCHSGKFRSDSGEIYPESSKSQ